MTVVAKSEASPVIIVQVPVVGDHVWFVSDDELTEGIWIDGEITAVNLDEIKVHVDFPGIGGEWNLKLSGKWKIPFYLSYTEFLEARLEATVLKNLEYRKLFGPLPSEKSKYDDEDDYI